MPTTSKTEPDDQLSVEGEYSGLLYWFTVPSGKNLSLDNLRTHLDGRVFEENISKQIDETTEVPDVFKENGQIVRRTSVSNVKKVGTLFGEMVVADVMMDRDDTVNYRDKKILTMNAYHAKLVVFEQNDVVYLLVVASRKVSTDVATMLRKKFDELGELINETRLSDDSLRTIVDDLDAALVDTIIAEFPDEDLTSMEFTGDGYGNNSDYEKQESRGKTQNHMFSTKRVIGADRITVRIANDGLVRIYNKVPLETYIRLVSEHIVPNVHRDQTGSASLETFEASKDRPIFEEDE